MMACLPGSNCFPRCSSSDSDKPSEAKITAEIRNEIKSVSHLVRKFHSVSNDYFIRSTPDEKPSDQNRM